MEHSLYYHRFLAECEALCVKENLAPSTIENKLSALRSIFQEVPILTHDNFMNWIDRKVSQRTKTTLGPHGKNRYIKALMWYLHRSKIIPKARELAKLLDIRCFATPPSSGKIFSADEFEDILQYAPDERHDLAFRLMYEAGFRPHELLSLRTCNIDNFKTDSIPSQMIETRLPPYIAIIRLPNSNPVTPSGRNKTGSRTVLIRKNAETLLNLAEHLRREGGTEALLFPYAHKHFSAVFSRMKHIYAEMNGESPKIVNDSVTPFQNGGRSDISDLADILPSEEPSQLTTAFHKRLYDLRHTAITEMYALGLNDQIIRSMVGWRPASKMPNTYVHIGEQHLLKSVINTIGQHNTNIENYGTNLQDTNRTTPIYPSDTHKNDISCIDLRLVF